METDNFELGRQIHRLVIGMWFGNTVVWTARLVNKCREGHFDEAVDC